MIPINVGIFNRGRHPYDSVIEVALLKESNYYSPFPLIKQPKTNTIMKQIIDQITKFVKQYNSQELATRIANALSGYNTYDLAAALRCINPDFEQRIRPWDEINFIYESLMKKNTNISDATVDKDTIMPDYIHKQVHFRVKLTLLIKVYFRTQNDDIASTSDFSTIENDEYKFRGYIQTECYKQYCVSFNIWNRHDIYLD